MKQPFTLDRDHVVLPKGTRVVLKTPVVARDGYTCKPGTIAQVSDVDHPHYTITTPAGRIMDCDRSAVVIQRQRVRALAERRSWDWEQLQEHIVLAVVVGSQAWNLADASSDTDIKGAWLLPFDIASGLWEAPDEIHEPGSDAQYWEVEKLIRQGLRADANTLEALWSPNVLHQNEVGALLRERRTIFVSKHIYRSFGRYAISQFDKVRQKLDHARIERELIERVTRDRDLTEDALLDALARTDLCADRAQARQVLSRLSNSLFDRGLSAQRNTAGALAWLRAQDRSTLADQPEYRPKNAYNLLRLLHSGIQWMRDGVPLIAIEPNRPDGLRERLLDVKHSRVPIEEVLDEAYALARDFEQAWETSDLPDEPDLDAADALLRACRNSAARAHLGLTWVRPPMTEPTPPPMRTPRFELPTQALHAFLERYAHLDTVLCAVVGAHDFGFPSPDSDIDLKGIHIAPAAQVLGLDTPVETANFLDTVGDLTLDYTSHEAAKAIKLLLGGNGNILERLLSPYQLLPIAGQTAEADRRLTELRQLAINAINTRFARHYRGFFQGVRREYQREPTVKGLLYLYRIGLTGIHLMRTGQLLPDLHLLLEIMPQPHAHPLMDLKLSGVSAPTPPLSGSSLEREALAEVNRLHDLLETASEKSTLPQEPPNQAAFGDWLERWRTAPLGGQP